MLFTCTACKLMFLGLFLFFTSQCKVNLTWINLRLTVQRCGVGLCNFISFESDFSLSSQPVLQALHRSLSLIMAAEKITDLPTPCLLVDLDKVQKNADQMLKTCEQLDISLRPHTKTHKTLEGALIQTKGKKKCIAVSTLAEAEFYAENGFDDILLAHPFSQQKVKRCLSLVRKLEKFHVMVSDMSGIECLENTTSELPEGKKWSAVIEVDTGYGRTGFCWDSPSTIEAAEKVNDSKKMRLEAIYAHCGHSYDTQSANERAKLQESDVSKFCELQDRLKAKGIDCVIGTGSTPTCSLPIGRMAKFTEFHPGNYVFYDYEQYLLNTCSQSDIACKVMTRVIAHKPELNMIVIDCGFTGLSHDGMRQRPTDFCIVEGEANLRVVGMSQELGKVKAREGDLDCRKYPIGTILYLIPFHSCAAAAMYQVYYVHSAGKVVTTWTPVKGW